MTPQIEDWRKEFNIQYLELSNCLPNITEGTRPVEDIESVIDAGNQSRAWFYYDLDDYAIDYWATIILLYRPNNNVTINISTAEQLSYKIGIPVWDRNCPHIWILSVESHLL